MDLKVDNFSFKGLNNTKNRKAGLKLVSLLIATGLGITAFAQNNTVRVDTFVKSADSIVLTPDTNNPTVTEEILTPLQKSKFFPEKDNEIITSILSSLGIESVWCISDGNNMEAFGECDEALYKFYVRKSDNNSYYGIINKLVGTGNPETNDCCGNDNKTYAFILRDLPDKNSTAKYVKFMEFKNSEDDTSLPFGGDIFNMKNDINGFEAKYLSNETKDLIFTLK